MAGKSSEGGAAQLAEFQIVRVEKGLTYFNEIHRLNCCQVFLVFCGALRTTKDKLANCLSRDCLAEANLQEGAAKKQFAPSVLV